MANRIKLLKLKQRGFQFVQNISIAAPPAKAWAALLDMQGWFQFADGHTAKITFDPRLGGLFATESRDGSVTMLHGVVAHLEPNRVLRINGPMGVTHLPINNVMIWELYPQAGGKRTLLRFCQRTFGFLTDDIEKNFRGGWSKLLPQLKALAEQGSQRKRK